MAAFDRRLLRRVRSTVQAAALAFLLGGFLFWLTGAAVKLVRIGLGLPTFPWSAFFGIDDLALELAIAVFLSVPHFAVIAVGRKYVAGDGFGPEAGRRESLVVGTMRGATVGIVLLGAGVFWRFDPIVFLALPEGWIVIGFAAGAGWLAALLATSMRGGGA